MVDGNCPYQATHFDDATEVPITACEEYGHYFEDGICRDCGDGGAD
jgi:hypothetical protein